MQESMRFCQVAHCMKFFLFRLPPHPKLAFMSDAFISMN